MTGTKSAPPVGSLVVLSGDLLAVAAKNLLDQLVHSNWAPAVKLKDALDTYEAVRMGGILKDDDPQSSEPMPPRS